MSSGGSNWKEKFPPLMIVSGLIVGLVASLLVYFKNPGNMGVCMACFGRDIAGALGLHQATKLQYLRPEILGMVLGAALAALFGKELKPRSGSSPATRFLLGFFVMVGALVFLGCPTRMVLRLGGGDGNALLGLAGFTSGIAVGTIFLTKGTSLGRARAEPYRWSVLLMPFLALTGAVLLLTVPRFKNSDAAHAPMYISLTAGLLIGVLGQRSRLCFAGGIRDMILFRSPHLLTGLAAVFVGVFALNLALSWLSGESYFTPGFTGQPAAHNVHLWNYLGMALVGLGSVLLGGCPFRQVVLASQGNGDSIVALLGMLAGAATAHNFGLSASGQGVPEAGMIAVGAGLVICMLIGLTARRKAA